MECQRACSKKLKGIKADLVRGLAGWQDWDLPRLVLALKQWREINTVEEESNNVPKGKSCVYHAEERKSRARVYCESGDHVSSTCTRVTTLKERCKRECASIAPELSITPPIAGVGQDVRNVVKSTIHTSVPRKINS